MRNLAFAPFSLLVPAVAHAGGFEILEHGSAATGMVGAFTAKADDASAIFYNPGGLPQQEGWSFYAGGVLVTGFPSATIAGEDTDAGVQPTPIPTLYASYGLDGRFAFGLGAFTQFGLSVDWPDAWPGRQIATLAELRTVTINPTAAWQPLPWLGVGAGLDITPASVELTRTLDLVNEEGNLRIAGNTVAVGFNVAALATFPDLLGLQVGLSFRSGPDLDFDEAVLNVDAPPELSATLQDSPASTTIPLPDLLSLGVGLRPTPESFVQLQIDWHNWSKFQTLTATTPGAGLQLDTPQEFDDSATIRLGGELDLGVATARAGIGYDWTPVPANTLSPILPDADRWLLSAGAAWSPSSTVLTELAVMAVFFQDRQSDLPELTAAYSEFALLIALSVSYRDRPRPTE